VIAISGSARCEGSLPATDGRTDSAEADAEPRVVGPRAVRLARSSTPPLSESRDGAPLVDPAEPR